MAEPHHAIKAVARRTGLTAHVIRIWEKRYGAVKPTRTGTNRRLYSEEQIERLNLLRNATRAGHSIGHVAKLPTLKLRALATGTTGPGGSQTDLSPGLAPAPAPVFLEECLVAVKGLDARALEETLGRAETALGAQGLLQRVIAPLAEKIGSLWRDGTLTAAHEHFGSAVIRIFLGHAARTFAGSANSPVVVVGTPAGQLHELGALLVAAAAANLGWQVTYLGAGLPAAEIAGAARQNRARAVALSLVYPEDDSGMEGELSRLRALLPVDVTLLVGGRAAPAYPGALNKIGARQIKDLTELCATLDEIRSSSSKAGR